MKKKFKNIQMWFRTTLTFFGGCYKISLEFIYMHDLIKRGERRNEI